MGGTDAKKNPRPAKAARPARIRVTNKSLEARQFSTVRLPRSSEAPMPKVNVDAMFESISMGKTKTNASTKSSAASSAAMQSGNNKTGETGSGLKSTTSPFVFDPIPNDPMFTIVKDSQYSPPPSLDALAQQTGLPVAGQDGFDSYDRRADDAAARRAHSKVVKGELNHPRGKPRQNTITHFDDSSSSNSSDDGSDKESAGSSDEEKDGVSDESCEDE